MGISFEQFEQHMRNARKWFPFQTIVGIYKKDDYRVMHRYSMPSKKQLQAWANRGFQIYVLR